MKKEYDTFVENLEEPTQGQEITITVRDLTPGPRKYNHILCSKAIVSSSPDQLPEADVLWVRSRTGVLYPHPWAIKIIEELEMA